MTCNGDCQQGRTCNCDLDAKRIAELEAQLAIAIEALEIYSASKKVGLRATLALTKIKGE